jgi:hypothetical protein
VYELRYPGRGSPEWADAPVSWAEIGEAVGTTGEAARQRFGERVKARFRQELREWALQELANGTESPEEVAAGAHVGALAGVDEEEYYGTVRRYSVALEAEADRVVAQLAARIESLGGEEQ